MNFWRWNHAVLIWLYAGIFLSSVGKKRSRFGGSYDFHWRNLSFTLLLASSNVKSASWKTSCSFREHFQDPKERRKELCCLMRCAKSCVKSFVKLSVQTRSSGAVAAAVNSTGRVVHGLVPCVQLVQPGQATKTSALQGESSLLQGWT